MHSEKRLLKNICKNTYEIDVKCMTRANEMRVKTQL